MRKIYLDYNASTPIAPEVAAAMRSAMEGAFGNSSSQHWAGPPARQMIEKAPGPGGGASGLRPLRGWRQRLHQRRGEVRS